jgi:hypothetical protein
MRRTARRRRARARATAIRATVLLILLLSPSIACRRERHRDAAPVRAVDLLFYLKDAERRPDGGRFEIREHTFAGVSRASLIVPAGSRLTWKLYVPHRARLLVYAGVPPGDGAATAVVRLGISDGRRYETLHEQSVPSDAGWVRVAADLSFYAGRKLSLFYRPDATRWQIVIGTHVTRGAPPHVVLGEPGIETDTDSAREYRLRLIEAAAKRP